ncbi:hypothetical protein TEPIDINF_001256 [Tepidibacillus infernus]|uniref:hypothetical protein n=1 Tax=Tepidibacillus TaxID=1494427 RepID=UPI00085348BA|nr:hypothetical protein [Tepidibacillus sp. HK-1]GBF11108.1 hypothetical protein HK1_01131 [Tepidibacillus sp. HK-1]
MAKQIKDRQIAYVNKETNLLVSQIVSGTQSLLQQTKQLQSNPSLVVPIQQSQLTSSTASNNMQMSQQNFKTQQLGRAQQHTSVPEMQHLDQMLQKFYNEIGKMETEYNQLKSANMNPLHLQQLMQQKANALQSFSNQIQQTINQVQLSSQTNQIYESGHGF